MSRAYRVTPRARRDLIEIARYTAKEWGRERRDRYMDELDARFRWLASNPMLGPLRPEIDTEYRSFPHGAHIVFYIVREATIDIIGVPHRARDLPRFFATD